MSTWSLDGVGPEWRDPESEVVQLFDFRVEERSLGYLADSAQFAEIRERTVVAGKRISAELGALN